MLLLLSIVGFSCNMRASISHCAVVALPFVDVSSGEIVFPDKNDIVEALGMLQQCTKIHVQALGGCAGVLYDTIMAYVTCLHERRPADSVKPMFDSISLVTRHTSDLTQSQVF